MTNVGKVFSLFYSPVDGRTQVEKLDLDTLGIIGDKHYNKSSDRTVLIASLESYSMVEERGIEITKGSLGENILMDYNPYGLNQGDKFQIGDVIFEISQACTLCKSLTKIDNRIPKLLKNDRGIFAKVIVSGAINIGDSVHLLD